MGAVRLRGRVALGTAKVERRWLFYLCDEVAAGG